MDSNRTGLSEALTFAKFLDEFRRDFGGWSENTWRGNSGMLKRLRAEFGERLLIEISPRQVDGYLNRRRREGLAEATVNRYLCGLKTLFAVAKLWEYVEKSPVAEIKTLKEQGKVPEALTDDELLGLVAHCPCKLKAIVTIAADTGLRKSELQRLAWGDIDFGAWTITIRKSKNKDYRVIPMTDRSFGPDEVHFELLELIEAASPQEISAEELVKKVGIDEGSIFERITTMIIHGVPITFHCSDGCWQDFYKPEEMFYRIAKQPEDLTQVAHMIGQAQGLLGELKAAVQQRQGDLSAY